MSPHAPTASQRLVFPQTRDATSACPSAPDVAAARRGLGLRARPATREPEGCAGSPPIPRPGRRAQTPAGRRFVRGPASFRVSRAIDAGPRRTAPFARNPFKTNKTGK